MIDGRSETLFIQFIFTQTGVQDTQPNRTACGSLYSPLTFKKASIPVLFQTPYFRLQKMSLDSVEVKTLPTGKPYPLNCSPLSGFFSPLLLQEHSQSVPALFSQAGFEETDRVNGLEQMGGEILALKDSFSFSCTSCVQLAAFLHLLRGSSLSLLCLQPSLPVTLLVQLGSPFISLCCCQWFSPGCSLTPTW